MDTELQNAKNVLRAEVRARLKTLAACRASATSRKLCEQLRRQPVWSDAKSVLFFAPLADEPDLWPLLIEALAAGVKKVHIIDGREPHSILMEIYSDTGIGTEIVP